MATRKATTKTKKHLPVPNADSLGEFLENAIYVWHAKNPESGAPGRPNLQREIWPILDKKKEDGTIKSKPSYESLVKVVQMEREKNKQGPIHRDTIFKFVKAWRIIFMFPLAKIPDDVEWIKRKLPDELKTLYSHMWEHLSNLVGDLYYEVGTMENRSGEAVSSFRTRLKNIKILYPKLSPYLGKLSPRPFADCGHIIKELSKTLSQ